MWTVAVGWVSWREHSHAAGLELNNSSGYLAKMAVETTSDGHLEHLAPHQPTGRRKTWDEPGRARPASAAARGKYRPKASFEPFCKQSIRFLYPGPRSVEVSPLTGPLGQSTM